MKYYVKAIKSYVDFKGRASRKEYWMFYLFNAIFGTVAVIADLIIGVNFTLIGTELSYGIVGFVYGLFVIIPSLSIQFRRLHDINRSAAWILIGVVPVIGGIVLFVFSVLAGTEGTNRYGEPSEGYRRQLYTN